MASTTGRQAMDSGAAGSWGGSGGGAAGGGGGMGFAAGAALGTSALQGAGGDGVGTSKNPLVMTFVSQAPALLLARMPLTPTDTAHCDPCTWACARRRS